MILMNLKNFLFAGALCALALGQAGCTKDKTEVLVATDPAEGEILVAPFEAGNSKSGKLLVLDAYGNTLKEKKTAAEALNFQKWEVEGTVRYTYLEHNTNTYEINPPSIVPAWGVVLDENLNEIKRISLLPYNERTAGDPSAIDAHEFIYLNDHHFITIAYFEKAVNNIPASLNPVTNCKVVAPIIQEIENDQVVWEWDASRFPEFYEQSVEGNQFSNAGTVHDYMHLNSVFIDPNDNNLICSFRNTNQVVKINRTTGDILWRLGGTNSDFPLAADQKFLRQHHATLTDNNQTLLLFDNGNKGEREYSRVLEFQLGEAEKSIRTYKAFPLPNGIFSQFMGSVQKIGDRYFIGCGSEPRVMEVNYNTGAISYLMQLALPSYRAFKY
ncbi:aryl-sulfate sulfotransferase [Paraflavisolibacter sp. H34]|uniref:arylsulfotransferase family protein n=1 Tax=Huijunlia imazamoxiresistens TaxID=3127457 RepID=UPI003015CC76